MLTKQHLYHAAKMLDALAAGKTVIGTAGNTNFHWDGNGIFGETVASLRIQPEPVRWRPALLKWANGTYAVVSVPGDSGAADMEDCSNFVRWLGDWQEVTP